MFVLIAPKYDARQERIDKFSGREVDRGVKVGRLYITPTVDCRSKKLNELSSQLLDEKKK